MDESYKHQQPSQPCAFDTQLRASHPLLELSLGCLEMQALTASTLQFERPQWLDLCLCTNENFSGHLLATLLRYTTYKITDDTDQYVDLTWHFIAI